MKPYVIWSDEVPEREGQSNVVNETAFNPDGTRLTVAVGTRVLLYNALDGDLITSLKAHKDTVMSVDWSKDGKRFASGGLDKQVVIWKATGEGMLRFTHNDAVYKVSHNPITHQVASVSAVDFGLWSPEQKAVSKLRVASKVLSAAWSTDGQFLALGMMSGQVSIRDRTGAEKVTIDRQVPVFGLAWCPSKEEASSDILVVGSWDQSLSFYQATGVQQQKERRQLGFDPTSVKYIAEGDFLIVGGTGGTVHVCSREGQKLRQVHETKSSAWVWSVATMNNLSKIAVGANDGSISVVALNMQAVAANHRDRYAFRENLTDVVVQHFITEQKVRIKCRDYVSHVALYKDRLAVQLPDRVTVYEVGGGLGGALSNTESNEYDMHYRSKEKVYKAFDADHLGVTSRHLVICHKRVVHLLSFKGAKEREWVLDAHVTALKVEGGPVGRECLLVGLANGTIHRLIVTNVFPVQLLTLPQQPQQPCAVKCLDLSLYRKSLAALDAEGRMTVWGMRNKEVIFQESNVDSMFFNSEVEEFLCYTTSTQTGNNDTSSHTPVCPGPVTISVKTSWASGFPVQQLKVPSGSYVVGFRSSRVYTIRPNLCQDVCPPAAALPNAAADSASPSAPAAAAAGGSGACVRPDSRLLLKALDVPLSQALCRHLELGRFEDAYRVATLGVTTHDWRLLAMQALRTLSLDVARLAFVRLRDVKYLDLVDRLVDTRSKGPINAKAGGRGQQQTATDANAPQSPLDQACLAEVVAYSGQYQEAAKMFARAGQMDRAIELFTDLRLWEEAKAFAANGGANIDTKDLIRRQAEWLEETRDWQSAVDMYVAAGDPLRAVKLVAQMINNDGSKAAGRSSSKKWQSQVLDIARSVSKHEKEILQECGKLLAYSDEEAAAREVFLKLEDFSSLMQLYIKMQRWDDAVKLAEERQGQFDQSMFVPYAEWLAHQDRFDEALEAYRRAGRPDQSKRLVEQLTRNAVLEGRYKDAAYYYWVLAVERAQDMTNTGPAASSPFSTLSEKDRRQALQYFHELSAKADIYYAFQHIHAYTKEPFTSLQPMTLFQVARFILNNLGAGEAPFGISKVDTLYTLAKQSKALGAYKLARFAYDRLQKLRLPQAWQDSIDLDMLTIQAKPVRDSSELLPVCYRCGYTNPLLNPFNSRMTTSLKGGVMGGAGGDACTNCGHPFVRSFVNFEVLPLIEFVPDKSITEAEALDMLRTPPLSTRHTRTRGRNWRENERGSAQVMSLDDDDDDGGKDTDFMGGDDDEPSAATDFFTACLNRTLEQQETTQSGYTPVLCNAKTLLNLRREEVFVIRYMPACARAHASSSSAAAAGVQNPAGVIKLTERDGQKTLGCRFFKNMLYPDIPIALSQPAARFFYEEDFEFAFLKDQACPLSRVRNVGDYGPL